jgi:hypothetical protein
MTLSKRRDKVKERELKALDMKRRAFSYEEIAVKLGYSAAASAYNAVQRALTNLQVEPAEDLRKLELIRLDGIARRYEAWAKESEDTGVNPDPRADLLLIKVMERRHKLLGLDAPTKVEQKTTVDLPQLSIEDARAVMSAFLEAHEPTKS